MRRLQLVELEDLEWFPAVIRNGATAILRAIGKMGNMGHFMAPSLARALQQTGYRHIVDLCSGGAGPLPEVLHALQAEGLQLKVLLTDKYPNAAALNQTATEYSTTSSHVSFHPKSVDATQVPVELTGFRTLFNAFHHFPPVLARGILDDAVHQGVPIAIYEIVERRPWAILAVLFTPFVALFLMLRIRPLQPLWWFYTYLIPLIPALLLWDGLVSCLRVYSPAELKELIQGIKNHDSFDWLIEQVWMPPLPLRCQILIGTPKD